MRQCPVCLSHNRSEASYCGECGARLTSAAAPGRRRLWIAAPVALVILTLIAAVAWIALRDGASSRGSSVASSGSTESATVALVEEPEAGVSGRTGSEAAGVSTEREPRVLKRNELVLKASQAFVVVELHDPEGRPWQQIRGVLVDPGGTVLCRYLPLLGAHSGVCRLGTRDRARVEILGVSYRDEALDLALLRVRRSPAGYAWLPVLREQPWDTFRPQDSVYVFSDYKPTTSAISEVFYTGTDGLARMRLSERPFLPPESFVAVDSYGFIAGLCRIQGDAAASGGRILLDPVADLADAVDHNVMMSLPQLASAAYEGTFADYVARGNLAYGQKDWGTALDSFEAAMERASFDEPAEADVAAASDRLLASYLHELQSLQGRGQTTETALLSERALDRYESNGQLWLYLGEARLLENNLHDGIAALVQAQSLGQKNEAAVLLETAYLELAGEASRRDDQRSLEAILLEGVERLPRSGVLYLELAELYFQQGSFDAAAGIVSEVPRLNPTLRAAAEDLQARIQREQNRRNAVVIPISSESSSYRTAAVLDGTTELRFIIDTGATNTTIPVSVAHQLGYNLAAAEKAVVRTANGVVHAPILQISSLDVHGYHVRNLRVLVLPDSTPPLLGLNFLRHFRYTVDAKRREFRLEAP